MHHARTVLSISGRERLEFLNRILSVAVRDTPNLHYGALLTPQGKLYSDLFIWKKDDALWLDIPKTLQTPLLERLLMYKLRADVQFEIKDLGVWQTLFGTDDRRDPRGALGYRYYGTKPPHDPMGAQAYLNARIQTLVPEFDVDFGSDEIYPLEWRFREMHGIDYDKGCYIGQEISARMYHKTTLKKTIFSIATNATEIGLEIQNTGGRKVGRLLSNDQGTGMAWLQTAHAQDPLVADGHSIQIKSQT